MKYVGAIVFGLTIAGLHFILIGPSAFSMDRNLNAELSKFRESPKTYLNLLPRHWDQSGNPVPRTDSPFFSSDLLANRQYVDIKNGKDRIRGVRRAHISAGDTPEDFVDHFELNHLKDMDERHLLNGAVSVSPWSDSYWPIAQGALAYRYADPLFPAFFDWMANSTYLLAHIDRGDAVSLLSPAEKYDLLVGDKNHTLTRRMLYEGKRYFDETGKVESWMGICHGWAPASYMALRPKNWVKVLAADGATVIPFFPSDIKALASLLWANGSFPGRQMGSRCNVKNPEMDENGRIIESSCFDDNPAAWHLAVVNQIGISNRPFVMDATFDYQVWNQPVTGYSYTYFNPQTSLEASSLLAAATSLKDFSADKFKKYRSPEAVTIVGVAMDVTYVLETLPTDRKNDSADNDSRRTVQYLYDLELDKNGTIVGGEWYTNFHPDFLWGPTPESKVVTWTDSVIDQAYSGVVWLKGSPIPQEWRDYAEMNALYAQPLSHIVDQLIAWAN